MCGIFAITQGQNQDTAPMLTLDGLRKLEYRGYDSWGLATLNREHLVQVEKEVGKIGDYQTACRGWIAIGHTRWATHGGVNRKNAHPHVSCDEKYAVVHNGIIDNYIELREKLQSKDHVFKSDTDTEVLAHLLEEFDFWESFSQLSGYNAVVVLDAEHQRIYGAKTGSPLVVGIGDGVHYLASDASALLAHTRNVYYLEDGQGVEISQNGLRVTDLDTGTEVNFEPITLNWSIEESQLGGYAHFLTKEIHDQPQVIRAVASSAVEDVQKLARLVRRSYGTYLVGCGTAYHAGLAGMYLLSRLAKRHVNVVSAGEFSYLDDFIQRGSLVMALTQSGETIDVVEAVKAAQVNGAAVAALVNVLGSTIYRLADARVLLRAGPEKAVLATKSYMAKLSVLLLLAYELRDELVIGQKLLLQVADEIEKILADGVDLQLRKLAEQLKDSTSMFLLGRGSSYADALEGALKIKEVTYIHAEGFAGGDLKHGSIALIEEKTPVVVFAPADETYAAIISNAMEVKARGAYVVGVSSHPHDVFDEFIQVGDVGMASNLVNIVPMQLLAYYLAIERGCDPDKPRNLAKSVTVR